jgi:hypothetical protein
MIDPNYLLSEHDLDVGDGRPSLKPGDVRSGRRFDWERVMAVLDGILAGVREDRLRD